MPDIEKRTGHDWTVVFRDPDDNSLLVTSVFGVNTAEQAVEQAHVDAGMPEDSDILLVVRDDASEEVLRHLCSGVPD
jgi:hypothetical protein